ncbi:cytochrome P450 [Glomus cerebriforme]|uniref:Cytochrome P450 n=1 Tax=Glomus cerebriforme TaxID=658196 RepID=A0A397T466_9GLOM|nr:cytochrome P450 [Glomus cerebriforme]
MFALLSFIFLLIVFIYIKSPRLSENEPPLVPYTIPVIGHTYSYLFDTENFIRKCLKKYGEPFNIVIFGKVTTIVAQKYIPEVLKAHESFDAFEVFKEFVPLHLILDYDPFKVIGFHAKTIREQISGKLSFHFDNMQKDILYCLDKWIGECDKPRNIKDIWDLTNHVIGKSIANACIGEEASQHEDVVHTFAILTQDMNHYFFLPPFLSFIHQKLHEYVISIPFLIGLSPISKHKNILINRMKPIVETRIQQKKSLGNSYKPSNDILEYYMSQSDFDSSNVNYSYLADLLIFLIVASIATTGRTMANLLFDYASRPEYWDELYEEASTINKECNGKLTFNDINKMIKLDSFTRESLRHMGDMFIAPHAVIADHYTFSNGYTIPKGRNVFDFSEDCLFSESKYGSDSKSFKPFQFVPQNISASKVDRTYVVFGGGRHACPGRFYAVLMMKLFLYNIILKYNVKTENDGVAKKVMLGPFTNPPKESLIFERRKEQRIEMN